MEKINIPLVQQDLSHEETIVQIALSLEKLGQVVTALFDNVNANIRRQNDQLAEIQERCASSRRKLEKLTSVDKSVRVLSSSKFPGPTARTFYPLPRLKIEGRSTNIRIPLTPLPKEKLSLKQKSKFYHIKDSTWFLRKNESITPTNGLGDPPRVQAVNSLLLFNTKHNVYSEYKILDPLTAHKNIVAVEEENRSSSPIGPAPLSLASADDTARQLAGLQGYLYSPSIQDVPDINVPLNLPNLSGIAGDLRFDEYDDRLVFEKSDDLSFGSDDKLSSVKDFTDNAISFTSSDKGQRSSEEERPIVSAPVQPAPPPPPPPPPPPSADFVSKPVSDAPKSVPPKSISESAKALPPVTDSRADLMAAIRKAGGKATLRPVSDSTELASSSQRSSKPGNFMEDLHAKLSMRRKGISGKVDTTEVTGRTVGMLDRINLMIPPPPPKSADTTNEEGSDWEE